MMIIAMGYPRAQCSSGMTSKFMPYTMPMSVGAILMSASTVVVALNAQLLRRLDLTPQSSTDRMLNRSK